MKDSKERFGSWTLAAASYNMGKLASETSKSARLDNYYDLLSMRKLQDIFSESLREEIFKAPKDYGFNYEPSDLYSQESCKEVIVDSAVTDLVALLSHLIYLTR